MARILVAGIGNVLNGDDGLGPYTVRMLEATWEMPAEVELLDAGTPGADLVSLLTGVESAIVVDAVNARGMPGELRRYDKAEILRGSPRPALSPHEPGLREALMTMDFRGGGPENVALWGAIPECMDQKTGLSASVRAAVGNLMDAVVEELRRLGAEPRRRPHPLDPEIWWERPAP